MAAPAPQKNEGAYRSYAVLAVLAVAGIGWWEGGKWDGRSHTSNGGGGSAVRAESSYLHVRSDSSGAPSEQAGGHDGSSSNVSPEVLKWRENNWPGMHCPMDGPVAFYKTHKTGSTTITNMLYRYSMRHQRKVFAPPGVREAKHHQDGCQHYEVCLPKHGDPPLEPEEAYDMALHHYHSVGSAKGIEESSGTWPEKWERYTLAAAGKEAPQLVSILREPVATFYSKFDYFRWNRQVGMLKDVVAKPQFAEGMTRDFGIYNDDQLDEFLNSKTFKGAFIFILEELELSLALWKVSCGLSWQDVVVSKSNPNVETRQSATFHKAKNERRMPLVKANHVRDYALYNTTVKKLLDAKASFPDQNTLAATIKRIRSTNLAVGADCKENPSKPYCLLDNLKPLALAGHLSPETHTMNIFDGSPWERLGNTTIEVALGQIKSIVDSYVDTANAQNKV